MQLAEARKLIRLGQKLGLSRLRLGELEVEYSAPSQDLPPVPVVATPSVPSIPSAPSLTLYPEINPLVAEPVKHNGRLPSDEDFLFMSSPFGSPMNEAGLVLPDEPGHEED